MSAHREDRLGAWGGWTPGFGRAGVVSSCRDVPTCLHRHVVSSCHVVSACPIAARRSMQRHSRRCRSCDGSARSRRWAARWSSRPTAPAKHAAQPRTGTAAAAAATAVAAAATVVGGAAAVERLLRTWLQRQRQPLPLLRPRQPLRLQLSIQFQFLASAQRAGRVQRCSGANCTTITAAATATVAAATTPATANGAATAALAARTPFTATPCTGCTAGPGHDPGHGLRSGYLASPTPGMEARPHCGSGEAAAGAASAGPAVAGGGAAEPLPARCSPRRVRSCSRNAARTTRRHSRAAHRGAASRRRRCFGCCRRTSASCAPARHAEPHGLLCHHALPPKRSVRRSSGACAAANRAHPPPPSPRHHHYSQKLSTSAAVPSTHRGSAGTGAGTTIGAPVSLQPPTRLMWYPPECEPSAHRPLCAGRFL